MSIIVASVVSARPPADRGVSDAARLQAGGDRLALRAASAAVLIPMALAAVWFGGWVLAGLAAAAAALMLREWLRLAESGVFWPLFTLALAIMATAIGLAGLNLFGASLLTIVSGAALMGIVAGLAGSAASWAALAIPYIVLPAVAIVWLRAEPHGGAGVVFWLLAVVWATDVGAYAVGRSVGGPKLVPRLSPGKTWAGLIGGVIAAMLVGLATPILVPGAPAFALAGVGAALAVIEQAGDLAESAFKRRFRVKDTANLIPGHGGVLDRLDGLLFVAPTVAVLTLLWPELRSWW